MEPGRERLFGENSLPCLFMRGGKVPINSKSIPMHPRKAVRNFSLLGEPSKLSEKGRVTKALPKKKCYNGEKKEERGEEIDEGRRKGGQLSWTS